MSEETEAIILDEELHEQNERFEFWQKKVDEFDQASPMGYNYIERIRPHQAIKVLMMLEQQEGQRAIMDACGVTWRTIRSLRERYGTTIQEGRKMFSKRFSDVAWNSAALIQKKLLMLEDDDKALMETSLKDLSLTMAIATDKGAMMDGMATQTIEVRRGASIGDASKMIAEARARLAAKTTTLEAEIVTPDADLAET